MSLKLIVDMKKIAIFCGASKGHQSIYKEYAEKLGHFLAQNQIEIVFGGGKYGMMGAVADAALYSGGKVTGVIPGFLKLEEILHSSIQEIYETKTMAERKVKISKMVDAYIGLPGGFGTLDEIMEVLTLGQLQIEHKPIGLLNINGFFNPLLQQFDLMVQEGFLRPENRAMVLHSHDIEGLWSQLKQYQPPKVSKIVQTIASK